MTKYKLRWSSRVCSYLNRMFCDGKRNIEVIAYKCVVSENAGATRPMDMAREIMVLRPVEGATSELAH